MPQKTSETPNTPPLISLDRVSFAYEDRLILDRVSLTIEKGQYVAIIGPNGGGKTTLLQLLAGLVQPSSGHLSLMGKRPQELSGVLAYVPQVLTYDRQFPISTLEVTLGGRLFHLPWWGQYSQHDKEKAYEALERVGLKERALAPFSSLSQGQQQRTLIARALAAEPQLLLLDEPTASIDPAAEEELYHLLDTLKGLFTLILVTHDVQAAIAKADRILCVRREVVELPKEAVCQHVALGLYHGRIG